MRIFIYPFIMLCLLSALLPSCSNDDDVQLVCLEILQPAILDIGYYDTQDNDLFFSSDPKFSADSLTVHFYGYGSKQTLPFTVEGENPKYFSIPVPPNDTGTVYIQLKYNLVDTVFYKASRNLEEPCYQYKIDSVFQNGNEVVFNQQHRIWRLIR